MKLNLSKLHICKENILLQFYIRPQSSIFFIFAIRLIILCIYKLIILNIEHFAQFLKKKITQSVNNMIFVLYVLCIVNKSFYNYNCKILFHFILPFILNKSMLKFQRQNPCKLKTPLSDPSNLHAAGAISLRATGLCLRFLQP